jgi:soluble lytic murein transglycosylase-like protein
MSFTSAMQRMSEIQTRMNQLGSGGSQSVVGTWRNFAGVMQTAQNRFNDGPTRIPSHVGTTVTSAKPASAMASRTGSALALSARAMSADEHARLTPELQATMQKFADKYGVPVALVKAVARAESGFRADAVSGAGAQGMMQLMPATGRGLGVRDPFDPAQSIEGGTRYLANALKMFKGDVKLAVASYNAGTGAVRKYGDVPPFPETQTYVQRVLSYARQYGLNTQAAA